MGWCAGPGSIYRASCLSHDTPVPLGQYYINLAWASLHLVHALYSYWFATVHLSSRKLTCCLTPCPVLQHPDLWMASGSKGSLPRVTRGSNASTHAYGNSDGGAAQPPPAAEDTATGAAAAASRASTPEGFAAEAASLAAFLAAPKEALHPHLSRSSSKASSAAGEAAPAPAPAPPSRRRSAAAPVAAPASAPLVLPRSSTMPGTAAAAGAAASRAAASCGGLERSASASQRHLPSALVSAQAQTRAEAEPPAMQINSGGDASQRLRRPSICSVGSADVQPPARTAAAAMASPVAAAGARTAGGSRSVVAGQGAPVGPAPLAVDAMHRVATPTSGRVSGAECGHCW